MTDRPGETSGTDPGIAAALATIRRLEGMLAHADDPAQFMRTLELLAGDGLAEGADDHDRVHAE